MSATTTFVNFYDILEVARTSTVEDIEKAIKQQRRTWAKRQSLPDQDRRHQAERRMREIADAEATLLDSSKRDAYDRELAAYRPPAAPAATGAAGMDWLARAREFLDRGDPSSAAYAAREATTEQGSNHAAWALRAEASLMLGKSSDCIFEMQEALRLQPDNAGYHFDLGTVFEGEGRWNEALASYENASRLAPEVAMFRVAIASVFLQNELPGKALPILEAAVKEEPDNPHFQFYLGVALHDLALETMTPLSNGSCVITSQESAEKVMELSQRALKLRFDDAQLRASLNENITLAERSLKLRFYNRFAGAFEMGFGAGMFGHLLGYWLVIGMPWMIGSSSPVLGVLFAIPWYFAMYKLFLVPGWKITDKQSKHLQPRMAR